MGLSSVHQILGAASSTGDQEGRAANDRKDKSMGAMMTDSLLCKGCTCCQDPLRKHPRNSGIVAIDDVTFLCSNMRVSNQALAAGKTEHGAYRLTAGDVEFFSEARS
jgi:hypothetical protein